MEKNLQITLIVTGVVLYVLFMVYIFVTYS
jgi:hypothetical protein